MGSGTFGYYTPKVPTLGYTAPTPILPSQQTSYQLPPAPTPTALPPPPQLQPVPMPTTSPFIGQLSTILSGLQNAQPYGNLPANIMSLLDASKTAALGNLDQYAKASQGQLLGDLFGSNMQRSSSAIDRSNQLSSLLGVDRANIEANYANQQLGEQKYAGGFGLQSLGQQAAVAGQGASLDQNQYAQMINAILGQGSLQNQQYATQSGNALQQTGLANQLYGTQTGNTLQQQQLALQQQQQLLPLIQMLLSSRLGGASGTSFGGGPTYSGGGGSGSFGGVPGQFPPTQGTQQIQQQQLYQQIFQALMRLLQGVG